MGLIQKTKDVAFIVRHDKKWWYILFFLLLIFVWMFLGIGSNKSNGRTKQVVKKNKKLTDPNETYRDLLLSFEDKLTNLQNSQLTNQKYLEEQALKVDQYEARTAEIFKKILERISDLEDKTNLIQAGQGYPNIDGSGFYRDANGNLIDPNTGLIVNNGLDGNSGSGLNGDGLNGNNGSGLNGANSGDSSSLTNEVLVDNLESFGQIEEKEKKKTKKELKKVAFIGAGDSVQVELIAGVNAPTDGTPYPVIFKLVGNVNGPDGSTLPLGEARLIASAQGSLSDSRALFRIVSMNFKLPDGSRQVLKVDGWVVGEDGIRGMKGVLIDPIGKALAGTAISSGIAGIGQGISQSQTTITRDVNGSFQYINGDIPEFALGRALEGSAGQWADFIKERSKLYVPHVKVFSGRKATAVFIKSVEIENLYNMQEKGNDLVFASLD